jgi:hypothetical protein
MALIVEHFQTFISDSFLDNRFYKLHKFPDECATSFTAVRMVSVVV